MKTWFITGTSRGFGREWTQAALERGDKVAATARNVGSLRDLVSRFGDSILPIPLNATDRAADFAAVKATHDHFGEKVVDAENPPLRLLLGEFATQLVPQIYEQRLKV